MSRDREAVSAEGPNHPTEAHPSPHNVEIAVTDPAPRVVVFGYADIGAACLDVLASQGADICLVVTHADDPGESRWFASVAARAATLGIPVRAPEHPNDASLVAAVRRLRPDLIFSFYYRRLLGKALLECPRLGAINLHGSLLPKYRGRAPVNWVLVHGESVTGVTLHYMDERADHGDIIAQRPVRIEIEDTAFTLSRKLTAAACALLADLYPAMALGRAPRTPQDHAAATIYGRRRPADGRIDWAISTWRIYNLIRAVTHPFPGAFTSWGDRRVFLWAARPPVARRGFAPPGRVLGVGPDQCLEVATADGVLEVLRLQLDGGVEMDGQTFAETVLAWPTRIVFGDHHRRST
jgi:methionyl-tRNA formyltransferase